MLIPSIDIQNGSTVQLVGGREKALDAGDPAEVLTRFSRVGEVAVIDLDAAMGSGSNHATIRRLVQMAPCRVGGGIRSVEVATEWLDAGAERIIIGTKATPELLSQLPKERLIAAVDANQGEVVDHGWQNRTGRGLLEKVAELRDFVSGFLVTFVEREGRLQGIDLEGAKKVIEAAGTARVTIAGGVTTPEEVRVLDELGADAQVGMALYTGRFSLADSIGCFLPTDSLWPTVVIDVSGQALGLVWSNQESLNVALEEGRGVYWSRRRGLWRKGESSGNVQELLKVELDCDRDSLRFTVRQRGKGFCHQGTVSCWGEERGISALEKTIASRLAEGSGGASANKGSYVSRLVKDESLLNAKICEEAHELAAAQQKSEVISEAADVIFFSLVKLLSKGGSLEEVEAELDRRALKVTRRRGDAKPLSKDRNAIESCNVESGVSR